MTGAGWIALIIIGGLAGLLATYVRIGGRTIPGGWFVGILLGLLGAYLGGVYLGKWGWMLGGLNVIGSIIVALLIPYIVEAIGPKTTAQP
ncbi:MAG: GlsB/YeaQ/YmgE family stress response membrane protein [Armatimonadota bacterium]|nr:GlsB/YeaQ/YmgE family stress response membrane protein [Armatimonadota bacterium]MDR5702229.1 GlsB/YeaQ/YmgE family stress response membrane protein [Armatimonadota bacterium]